MDLTKLQKTAKVAFASEFSFYLKAHNFHWNVEGPDFLQYHDLFGKIYEEVFDSIDPFAEQIRALDAYVPGSFSKFSLLTQIEDENTVLSKTDMVDALLDDNIKLLKLLKVLFDLSEEVGTNGFSDFVASRMDAHSKHGWMLRASLK